MKTQTRLLIPATVILLFLAILLSACAVTLPTTVPTPVATIVSTSASEETTQPQATAPPVVTPERVPDVDLSKRIVALEDIYFDTFRPVNRAVLLSEADSELIVGLRDAIPPIHNPTYESADEARWLSRSDMVIGYAVGDQAWAYPTRILNFHEIVTEHLGGEPVVISYCPLCYTGVVFSRNLTLDDGTQRIITFGNTSALYENDMVMLDYETGSYWWHVAGKAIVGELAGATLDLRPSMTIEWGAWRDLHPDTRVLSRDTGFDRDYGRDPFGSLQAALNQGNFPFPVSEAALDDQLLPGAEVLTVKLGDDAVAYPLDVAEKQAIADTIGEEGVVVFIDPDARSGMPFVPTVDGKTLRFRVVDGAWVDDQTGSTWTLAGKAVAGPLAGTQLEPLPSKVSFWFATVASEPDVRVWQ